METYGFSKIFFLLLIAIIEFVGYGIHSESISLNIEEGDYC